jgi:hypothetical protein
MSQAWPQLNLSLLNDTAHPYLAQAPAFVGAALGGFHGSAGSVPIAVAAGTGASLYYLFTSQNAYGNTTLDLVANLFSSNSQLYDMINSLAGGPAAALGVWLQQRFIAGNLQMSENARNGMFLGGVGAVLGHYVQSYMSTGGSGK